MTSKRPARAVVIGAGMAGLTAAKALASRVGEVTLVESDRFEDAAPRKGAPQGAHVHALLKSGEMALSKLYPGFKNALKTRGGLEFIVRAQWRNYGPTGWVDPIDIGLTTLSQTRVMLEGLLRDLTLAEPSVRLVSGRVAGIVADAAGNVTGVTLERGAARTLAADLVIDASGRGGGTLGWLAELGVAPPPEETVGPELRYVSALFTRRIEAGPDYGGWLMFPNAPEMWGAAALPVEGGRWLVSAFDRFGRQAPTEEAGFRAFLAALPDPKFIELLERERPLSEFRAYRIAQVRLRRFDRIAGALPGGWLPVGDTIATYNPLYAQGMSIAALHAQALGAALDRVESADWRGDLTRAYLPEALRPVDWAWRMGQSNDLRYPEVAGERTEATEALTRTVQALLQRASTDADLMGAYGRVIHLLAPPESLEEALRAAEGSERGVEGRRARRSVG